MATRVESKWGRGLGDLDVAIGLPQTGGFLTPSLELPVLDELERTIRIFKPLIGAREARVFFTSPVTGKEELFVGCGDGDSGPSEEVASCPRLGDRVAREERECPGLISVPLPRRPGELAPGRVEFHFCRGEISGTRLRLAHILVSQVGKICETSFLRMLLVSFSRGGEVSPPQIAPDRRMIGESRAMTKLRETIAKVASSRAPILITGETGSGKELVARAIHAASPRADKPFIAENCGAIPDQLVESELFGYARGAYTGASSARPGLIELASGGTFFLDEIGETTLGLQTKLLRVMDQNVVRRLGETKTRSVDVRFLSATNRDLPSMIQRNEFRRDLFFRLRAIEVAVPPLRERWEDIPLLSNHFAAGYSRQYGKRVRGFTEEAMRCLMSYGWPGNIRELENEIQRAVLMCPDGGVIEPRFFSESVCEGLRRIRALPGKKSTLKCCVEALERQILIQAMSRLRGNKTKAASRLGLSRAGLNKKLKRYGLAGEF